ncbi:putative proline-rich receptor-like protein kinase PERK8 [Iris pallida]|uniref:Proline-rich receptor-like protein kinase PERK8 n=1 Tax=Iris pallida TaxID=29817 RepID=A0AAX6H6K6_IRIPA|nr:putative proline-rich receptor-like protein kinase PERK8 [Iris pallida]
MGEVVSPSSRCDGCGSRGGASGRSCEAAPHSRRSGVGTRRRRSCGEETRDRRTRDTWGTAVHTALTGRLAEIRRCRRHGGQIWREDRRRGQPGTRRNRSWHWIWTTEEARGRGRGWILNTGGKPTLS